MNWVRVRRNDTRARFNFPFDLFFVQQWVIVFSYEFSSQLSLRRQPKTFRILSQQFMNIQMLFCLIKHSNCFSISFAASRDKFYALLSLSLASAHASLRWAAKGSLRWGISKLGYSFACQSIRAEAISFAGRSQRKKNENLKLRSIFFRSSKLSLKYDINTRIVPWIFH